MTGDASNAVEAAEAAKRLAAALELAGCEYALGGAIALGFWAAPRGTLDVDVTLFLPADKPSQSVRLLQQIGCELDAKSSTDLLMENGYCQVIFAGRRVDVFLPLIPFYEQARQRRRKVRLGGQDIFIWDAETLCVFKMMFFRRKDVADVEQILRTQGKQLDRDWIRQQLIEIHGKRDPRVAQWEELVRETDP